MLENRLLLLSGLMVLIDIHVYTAVFRTTRKLSPFLRRFVRIGMWTVTALSMIALIWYSNADPYYKSISIRQWVVTSVLIIYASKLLTVFFILIDDIQVGVRLMIRFLKIKTQRQKNPGKPITRSEFLDRTAILAGGIPFVSMVTGILHGATDYELHKKTIYLPNLPKAFDGIRIGQLSDIHSGTFFNKTAVKGGVEMLMNEKPDVIFFTGDLVNYGTDEVNDYIGIFDKVRAPLGVFSTTGNHDYGNYRKWSSVDAKAQNFRDMLLAHRQMGYTLLMNEHRLLEFGEDRLAIIGVENWGVGPSHRFPKYGKLAEACKNMEDVPVRLLLSHDPSHWDAQIRPEFSNIDITFSGHTHGFQLGVEVGDYRWSPSQYLFRQWAGLYKENNQYLYVNRGFGCIGYPGRIGIAPELTVIELRRSQ